jgi:hypothetical protein
LNCTANVLWAGEQLVNVKPYALACWLQVRVLPLLFSLVSHCFVPENDFRTQT